MSGARSISWQRISGPSMNGHLRYDFVHGTLDLGGVVNGATVRGCCGGSFSRVRFWQSLSDKPGQRNA